ncbi:MAG TPA: hypothetical protein VGE36_14205 [Roseateles sp.]
MGVTSAGTRTKSIQAVTLTIAAGNNSGSATISAVNTSRTMLEHLGQEARDTGLNYGAARLRLTNATTVTATREGGGGSLQQIIEVQVVELD